MGRIIVAAFAVTLIVILAMNAPTTTPPTPGIGHEAQPSLVENKATLRTLQARYKALSNQLAQLMPNQPYILVDTARNRLYVKRQDEVVLDAIASTGSGTILDKPGEGNNQWVFDTPRGEFLVKSKLTNPTWIKPDWAFVEEGLAVPQNAADRAEQGVLGDYALGFGKGYFIHGTLYTRLLGKNVTHGCIRLNDNDLKGVYKLARVGTPIMIF
ncbi:MAG: L,D-transpeptidase [Nitrospira sp.]|nr:L,D-transpeptidase [Nitrospira sp.]MDH4305159.1 L,D-transpeptidase [Nitrospira sp.]MDH5194958.1 L,D-transpeptidase [Nitrospira sp.]